MKKKYSITSIIYDKRGRILSIGKNCYEKTHTLQAKYANSVGLPDKIFIHSEIHAIIRCRDISKAHTIFVSRYSAEGIPQNARPCPICMEAIKDTPIKFIKHT